MVLTAVRTEPKNEKEKNPSPFTRKNDPPQPSLRGRESLPGENKDSVGGNDAVVTYKINRFGQKLSVVSEKW